MIHTHGLVLGVIASKRASPFGAEMRMHTDRPLARDVYASGAQPLARFLHEAPVGGRHQKSENASTTLLRRF